MTVAFQRFASNPLLIPTQVEPSDPRLKVVGVFNAGGIPFQGGTLLLCRVAEASLADGPVFEAPIWSSSSEGGSLDFLRFRKDDPDLDFSDSRIVMSRSSRRVVALTSLSRLRIARSADGQNFTFDPGSGLPLDQEYDVWGAEDPRITPCGDGYLITYTSVSAKGAAVSLLRTSDFVTFERLGVVLAPSNKDVVIFPETVGGQYWMVHRPMPQEIGIPETWICSSPDLIHWGNHRRLFGVDTGAPWESQKLGAATPPLRLPEGWLLLYHGVDSRSLYSIGAVLLAADDPTVILARTISPLMVPEESYELEGFFGNAVFPCAGWIEERQGEPAVVLYYGSSDSCLCGAWMPVRDILSALRRDKS